MPDWMSMNDLQRVEAIATSAPCAGMTAQQVADYINTPRDSGQTVLRGIVVQEIIDYLSAKGQAGWAQIEAALANAGTTAAVKAVKRALQFPGTTIPADKLGEAATAMTTAGLLVAADVTALSARVTTHVQICLVHAPLEQGGLAWLDPTALVTAGFVTKALGG